MANIPVGKLPANLLIDLLHRYTSPDERIVLGPGIGEDATIINMGDRYLVAKTDPVTFATDQIGWYAVHVNANDIVCCGATPRWFLATLLLPENETTPELVETIFRQIAEAFDSLNVSLCGGHTEITYGLDRPIVVGQMLGEVAPNRHITSSGTQIGDKLILTKSIAIEGTALIAKEKPDAVRGVLDDQAIQRCVSLLRSPGISVVRDARLAIEVGGVRALHDPTEGGIATALRELAQAADVGLLIEEEQLSVLPECDLLCQHFGLNPLGLIASGSLLIAADEDHARSIVERLKLEDIWASVIGEVVPADQGCKMRKTDQRLDKLPVFARDEITRLFE